MSAMAPAGVLLAGALAAGLLVLGSAGAQGAGKETGGLSYSVNGEEFRAVPGELFDSQRQLVPGDRLTGEISIRNDRGEAIEVTVEPAIQAPPTGLRFDVVGRRSARLEPQQHAQFTLEAWLPAAAGNFSQDQKRALGLEVSAVEVTGAGTPEPPAEQMPDELGSTGFGGWALPLAAGMAGTGTVLYLRSRRQPIATQAHEGELP